MPTYNINTTDASIANDTYLNAYKPQIVAWFNQTTWEARELNINPNGSLITVFWDSSNLDPFGRLRVSNPKTLLDLKQNRDNLPLFYDDAEVSWGWTWSAYQTNKACTRISVSETTAW
jgi:hypothetical protein